MKKRFLYVFVPSLAVGACSSSSTETGSNGDAGKSDAAAGDAAASKCGKPGDQGNALGVGKYCEVVSDCNATPEAHVCSVLGDQETHFCTKICVPPDAGDGGSASNCGAGASCECDSRNCGCTPVVCL
jgi:hypothetical protein